MAVTLAARAALRVLPIIWRARKAGYEGNLAAGIILPVSRATAAALAAGKYPAMAAEPAADSAAFAAFAADSAAAAAARFAADSAAARFAAAFASASASASAASASASASASAASNADVQAIEKGVSAQDLAARKLWPSNRPRDITALWTGMKKHLLAQKEDWEVWTDWYEARLKGQPAIEELEIARVMIADDIWRQGPKVVNAEIKRLIDEFTPLDSRKTVEALKQRPAAFRFRIAGDKIDAAPEDAIAIDKDTAEDFYQETKRKAQAIKERFARIQADEHLRANIDLLLDRLGPDSKNLRPGLILSSLRSLQADVRTYDTAEGQKEFRPDDLSKLVDLADTARDLTAIFPISREIEAEAVALDLPESKLKEIEHAVVQMVDTVNESDGATESAKTAIVDAIASVPNARSPLDKAKQLSYALLDLGNATRTGLQYLKSKGQKITAPIGQTLRGAGGELKGLGTDNWRAIRKGMPKGVESGAREIGKAMIVGGAAALMAHWFGPVAALGTFVGPYMPLKKIAADLVETVEDIVPEPSDLETPDIKIQTPRKSGTRKAPAGKVVRKPTPKK